MTGRAKIDQRTTNLTHYPANDATDPRALSTFLDDFIPVNGGTVANLPSGSVGQIKRVTDANSPSVGSTVAGGGAAPALVWYNGSNWTVIGV